MNKKQLVKDLRQTMGKGIPDIIQEITQSVLPVEESMLDDKGMIEFFVSRFTTGLTQLPQKYVDWCTHNSKNTEQFIDRAVAANLAFRARARERKLMFLNSYGYIDDEYEKYLANQSKYPQ